MHSENFTLPRLSRAVRDRVRPALTRAVADLEVTAWHAGGEPAAVAVAADYRPFPIGGRWGKPWDTTWFRLRGTVPASVPAASRRCRGTG